MNRDDIIRMAREADCGWTRNGTEPLLTGESQIQRFAALVAAEKDKKIAELTAERDELLAKLQWIADQEQTARDCMNAPGTFAVVLATCAAEAIRARGEEPKRHPGYIIGDHWLQAAYTRVCTGEDIRQVMEDYGYYP